MGDDGVSLDCASVPCSLSFKPFNSVALLVGTAPAVAAWVAEDGGLLKMLAEEDDAVCFGLQTPWGSLAETAGNC